MKNSINIIEINKMFYNVYEIDAHIFHNIFGYKILENIKVGFPSSILNKVINTLEDNHINYNIIFKDKNNIIKDFKNRNNYNKYKDKAIEQMDINNKVNMMIDKIKNASKDEIERLVYIIYEVFK